MKPIEPFGYFKAEPFGWTDCAETDEGAIALYEKMPDEWIAVLEQARELIFEQIMDTKISKSANLIQAVQNIDHLLGAMKP